jgi:ferrous iron transport protein B
MTREREAAVEDLLETARALRWETAGFHERLMETLYAEAARIADRAVGRTAGPRRFDLDAAVDRVVTSRVWGFPLMLLLFTAVFWATIRGANVPSAMIADALIGTVYPALRGAFEATGAPWWATGLLIDGGYLATAWVVSVMLPPMAIFFPLFTILEDLGYLPRVAFNLDGIFRRAGAHGKQVLTTMMGFGCNAAGVIATRIIDSPRERLIAILTNNFAICNGRWPTQILVATIFIGALAPPAWGATVAAASVVGVAVLGVGLSLGVSWVLSRTVLRGEVSTFNLELPPYRPPRVLRTLYTSLIDRTIFVLVRAVVFAIPAGLATWAASNVMIGDASLAAHAIRLLDPWGALVGLNGVILLAYILAIPANEVVIPTILMLTLLADGTPEAGAGAGVIFETETDAATLAILGGGGWTLLTAVNLMIFSLVHNPCSTTLYTVYRETGSARWTAVAALLPLGMGLGLCFFVAQVWRLLFAG